MTMMNSERWMAERVRKIASTFPAKMWATCKKLHNISNQHLRKLGSFDYLTVRSSLLSNSKLSARVHGCVRHSFLAHDFHTKKNEQKAEKEKKKERTSKRMIADALAESCSVDADRLR